jgi:hypothetical protein
MPAASASLVLFAGLGTALPFSEPSAESVPTITLAPRSPAVEPPAPTLELPRQAAPPEAPSAPPTEAISAEPEPVLPEEPAPAASNDEDAPAASLAEVEAQHQSEAAESLALQPAAPETLGPGNRRRPPSVWGRLWLSGSIIASPTTIGLGLGAVRFVTRRIGLGLDVEDMVVLDVGSYNLFQVTPKAVFLLLPSLRVTPIASAGFGGAFFSSRLGVYGRWVAGAGLMFAIREHLRFGLGLDMEGLLPKERFYHHFECRGGGQGCHISPVPWISFGFRG